MIVEVGYISETRYAEKLQEKMTQPEKLQSALSRAGIGLILLPVMIGTTGGISTAIWTACYMHIK